MATKITDYTLEIGWSGTKVTRGLDLMIKKLNKAVTAANKLATATQKINNLEVKQQKLRAKTSKRRAGGVVPMQPGQRIPGKVEMPFGGRGDPALMAQQFKSAEKKRKEADKAAIASQKIQARKSKEIEAQKKAAERSNKSAAKAQAKRSSDLIKLDNQKFNQLTKVDGKIRSVNRSILGMDMTAKNAKGGRESLRAQIGMLEAYKQKLVSTTITTKSQMEAQKRAFTGLASSVEDVKMRVGAANRNFSIMAQVMKGVKNAMRAGFIAAVGLALMKLTGVLYSNGKAWENLRIQMQASFGSAEAGAERMDFLIRKSKELGVDVKVLADGYAKIGVAARMSNISTEDSENIFLAAAEASRAFGLGIDDTQGVMRAFSQMMGKNQVMMEELKLQLGDRMPSAMGIFAKSMGLTVKAFMEQVKAGKVGNKELANFAKFLRADIRASGAYAKSLESVEASQSRFNTALSQAGDAFFSGSLKKGVAGFFNMFATFMSDTKEFWAFLGEILGWMLRFGIQILRIVLFPIQLVLQTIGRMWKWIFDHAMADKKDIKNMNILGKAVKYIYLLFVDVMIILLWIEAHLDEIFSAPDWVDKLIELMGLLNKAKGFEEIRTGKTEVEVKKTVSGEETAFTTLRKGAVGKKSTHAAVKAYQLKIKQRQQMLQETRPLDAAKPIVVKGDLNVSVDASKKTPREAVQYVAQFTQDMLDGSMPTTVLG